jgi:hypothetical protein
VRRQFFLLFKAVISFNNGNGNKGLKPKNFTPWMELARHLFDFSISYIHGEPLWLSGKVVKNEKINDIERTQVRSPPRATSFFFFFF